MRVLGRKYQTIRSQFGFSEFEFLGLIVAGLLIAGLLAHFVFDQSIQVERLNALVARDAVRLNLENRLTNSEIIEKSVGGLPLKAENDVMRICVSGPQTAIACGDKSGCCESRLRRPVPIVDLGETRHLLTGTDEEPSCLDQTGNPVAAVDCFATAQTELETVCAGGAPRCKRASAILVHYKILFTPDFLKNEPDLNKVERTVSIILAPSASTTEQPRR